MLRKLLLWSNRNCVSQKTKLNSSRRRALRTLRDVSLGMECLESRAMLTNNPVLTVFSEEPITFGEELLLHIEDVATFTDAIVESDVPGDYFYTIECEEAFIFVEGFANIDFGAGPGQTLIGSFDAADELGGIFFPATDLQEVEYEVTLTLTDPDGGFAEASFTAIIEPTIEGIGLLPPQIETLENGVEDILNVDEGVPYVISLDNNTLSIVEDWTIFWGDGEETFIPDGAATSASHIYTESTPPGVQYYINAKVNIGGNAFWVSPGVPFVTVNDVASPPDGVSLVNGKLSVIDTNAANDIVTVTQSGSNISVTSSGNTTSFNVSAVDEIKVVLGSGADVVVIGSNITLPVTIDGGDGNDFLAGGGGDSTLIGGNGNDILWGAAGDDVLLGGAGDDDLFGGGGNDALVGGVGNDIVTGGAGRDLLIGSENQDLLVGGAGEDILIGSHTIHDNNIAALENIMAIWGSADDFDSRVDELTDSGGWLQAGAVFDDNALDIILGGAGRDLVFGDTNPADNGVIDLIALHAIQDRLVVLS